MMIVTVLVIVNPTHKLFLKKIIIVHFDPNKLTNKIQSANQSVIPHMPGRPSKKVFCESMTRASNYTVQCRAKGYLMKSGHYRCKNHAGMSTGPKSIEGKLKALKNLVSMKHKTDDELRKILGQDPGATTVGNTTDQDCQTEGHARTDNYLQVG